MPQFHTTSQHAEDDVDIGKRRFEPPFQKTWPRRLDEYDSPGRGPRFFRHNDAIDLERKLAKASGRTPVRLDGPLPAHVMTLLPTRFLKSPAKEG